MAPRLLLPLVLISFSLGACASTGPTRAARRTQVQARLTAHLKADPNRALCERMVTRLSARDEHAVAPDFNYEAFATRMLNTGLATAERLSPLKGQATEYPAFTTIFTPKTAQFLCLGTRQMNEQPYLVVRSSTPTRFDYLLFHLSGQPTMVDDFQIASTGVVHSELNALSFSSPEMDKELDVVTKMLQLSYNNGFREIIALYRTLSPRLQNSPIGFNEFINAVFTLEKTGSPLYQEAVGRIDEVFAEQELSRLYWRFIDQRRRGGKTDIESIRSGFLSQVDDYLLLD